MSTRSRSRGPNGSEDLERLKLPRLVRSQLRRRRRLLGANGAADIEERVREALYGSAFGAGRRSDRQSPRQSGGRHDT